MTMPCVFSSVAVTKSNQTNKVSDTKEELASTKEELRKTRVRDEGREGGRGEGGGGRETSVFRASFLPNRNANVLEAARGADNACQL